MLDKLNLLSLGIIGSLMILHFLGDDCLQTTSPTILQNHIALIPTLFSTFGAALFLIKGYASYKAMERMVSRAAIVEKYYKIKIITNVTLQTMILLSDLIAFYALAMFSIVFAYGFVTTSQMEVYHSVELYALIFIPIVSIFSIWFEKRSSASMRIR
jgi:hypothetical protein